MSKPTESSKQPASRSLVATFFVTCALLPASALAETATAQSGADLSRLLEQQGWQTQSTADGTLTLNPPGSTDAQKHAVPLNSDTPSTTTSASTPEIKRLLLQRGWRTETDAAGNTLLLPAGGNPQADQAVADPQSGPVGDTTTTAQDAAPFDQFKNALSAKGWRVESTTDGSLMVFPPAQAADAAKSAAARLRQGYCEGVSLAALTHAGISLPIDNQSEAAILATDWIANFGRAADAVGRIRRVNRVYSVSIVDQNPPYFLRHQLIIRRENGAVISVE